MLRVGKLQDGTDVCISQNSPNYHISVLGISGSGKTVRLREMIKSIVSDNGTVLIFDINGTDYNECADKMNLVSAVKNGLNVKLLDMEQNGCAKDEISYVMCIVKVLSKAYRFGSRQEIVLRSAILDAIQCEGDTSSDLIAIKNGLQKQRTAIADSVENQLWEFLNMDIIKRNGLQIKSGYANVISFEGLNQELQRIWMEIMLTLLWRNLRFSTERIQNEFWIFIDEFQNLSLKKDSILLEMLRESRKYNVNIVLATQSMAGYGKDIMAALDQTATHLYFRQSPTDIKKIASIIDVRKKIFWEEKLKGLKVGESVAVGNFSIRGKAIDNPIIIKSEFRIK